MKYPLELKFKWSFAPQIAVSDESGQLQFFVRQKLFKLKEAIGVFGDEKRTQLRYEIKADRVIDFSARYNFSDPSGQVFGAVKRRGLRSIWRARYDIFNGEEVVFTISEKNPWVKIADALLAEVPIVGMFTGYFFNPTYLVTRAGSDPKTIDLNSVVMRLEKVPAFFSRIFTIKQVDQLGEQEETQVLLSMLMMLLLERHRG